MPFARLVFYSATAAGIALAVKAVVFDPPPLWVAVVALLFYIALVTVGVVFSGWSMFADVMTLGPKGCRGVALTFDDGPEPRSTPIVLDLLDKANALGTFFVIGHKAEKHPELIREIHKRGHAIGIHSYGHERTLSLKSPRYVRDDFERASVLLFELIGVWPVLLRAPVGNISPAMASVARKLKLVVVGWSVRAYDGLPGAKPKQVARRVRARLRDGAIILLHDAAERGDFVPASIDALPEILTAAARLQLPLIRLDSWIAEASCGTALADGH